MHRRVVRVGSVLVVSVGLTAAGGGVVAATTLPDDSAPTGDTAASDPVPSDPGLDAAVAAFDERMTEAGFTELRPGPPIVADPEVDESEAEALAQCDPAVAEVIGALEESGAFLGGEPMAAAVTPVFGPATDAPPTTGTTTPSDPFSMFTEGSEEVTASLQRLDESQIEAVDAALTLMGSPEFADCFETLMTTTGMGDDAMAEATDFSELSIPDLSELSLPDFSELSLPDFSELSLPDFSELSLPDFSELSLPDFSELSIPDFSELSLPDLDELTDLSLPEMPDVSLPDLSSVPGLTPDVEIVSTADVGIGDASARLSLTMSMVVLVPFELSADTVVARAGDVLVTVSHSRVNTDVAEMDVDLAEEAQAIIDSL